MMKLDVAEELIKKGNLHKCVPEHLYDESLAATYEVAAKKTGIEDTSSVAFDPEKHLTYYSGDAVDKHKFNNTRRLTMEELGLSNKRQISPIGVSDPFPLFTEHAVDIMRQELLRKELFMKYARFSHSSTSGLDCSVRGYVKTEEETAAPFTYQAWTHPKTMELISTMAGVDLEVVMDYEIAHANVGMKSPHDVEKEVKQAREKALSGIGKGEDIPAIVGWHYDSYPFVCVLMLSDTTNMIGGETSLRMGGEGKLAVVPSPQRGSAAILQGRLIEHIAPTPSGVTERITMVTSYRAKNPLKFEDSVLSTVKPEINFGSRYNDFYKEWIGYRTEILKARLDDAYQKCANENGEFDKEATTGYLKEIEEYLVKTYKEMEV